MREFHKMPRDKKWEARKRRWQQMKDEMRNTTTRVKLNAADIGFEIRDTLPPGLYYCAFCDKVTDPMTAVHGRMSRVRNGWTVEHGKIVDVVSVQTNDVAACEKCAGSIPYRNRTDLVSGG
jgi:hypothetical protein